MEREWKLGVDLFTFNNILDEITFDELIKTVHCNCENITPQTVKEEFHRIMKLRLADAHDLLERNINEIVASASEGRN
jgi:hypothetical protein